MNKKLSFVISLYLLATSSWSSSCIDKAHAFFKGNPTVNRLESIAKSRLKARKFLTMGPTRALVRENNLMLSTTGHESLRELILEDGFHFKNAYSQGVKTSAAATGIARLETEEIRLGKARAETEIHERPFYGFLMFKRGLKIEDGPQLLSIPQFGEDIWVFKTDKLIEDTTFTIGDSMDSYHNYHPLVFNQDQEDKLYDLFLPLKKMNYILEDHFVRNREQLKKNETLAEPFAKKRDQQRANYIELQFFNQEKLNVQNIEKFYFTKKSPSKELFDYLRSYGIKVYDWRIKSLEPRIVTSFELMNGRAFKKLELEQKVKEVLRKKVYLNEKEFSKIEQQINTLLEKGMDGQLEVEQVKEEFLKIVTSLPYYNKFHLHAYIGDDLARDLAIAREN
ncbi:hypothetical protein HBN50_01100 [Halobacteriovorax sp. GB3]|uniref:hypothetical protein n=1 Tax=Halobacteriovorax sp. GB3 TaxID=2719615 RepID=UPI0023610B74|nr:hypothetical protein [Halobacteriovorax sp. GB3]MDD0851664.1 hypothetical protein [Halobacteriovorax sp. GB3]